METETKSKSPWMFKERPWRWQEDGLTVTRGAAFTGPGCHNGCGVLLYTNKEDKLVKVEGDPDNNFNQGRLCLRCLALRDVVNHPDRLKYPMKRVGKRGTNKWKRISWDEALDTVAERFNKIKAEYGAEAVVFSQGTGRDIVPYIERLSFSFGSPNYVCMGLTGNACYIPRISLQIATHGGAAMPDCSQYLTDRYDDPHYKVPECILIWGYNPVVCNEGGYGHWYVDLMKRGSKLIVVDPRMTWLASRADIWLQIRPGTDSALALGMLNIIIQEGLYDKEFVDKWTYGFDDLAKRAAEYPVEKVAEITWIPKEKIVKAARLYARSKPALVAWGLAIDMTKESLPAAQGLTALWDITGNIDVPGGNLIVEPPCGVTAGCFGWGFELLPPKQFGKRLGMDKYPLLEFGLPLANPDEVVETMLTDKPYPLKACWFQTNNPIACMSADPKKMYKALSRLEFVVVVDLFMTPTATAFADIVLPAACFPERDGCRAWWYSVQTINKVTQTGECKSDLEINRLLGRRLNPEAWPWDNEEQVWDAILAGSGMTFKEVRDKHQVIPPFEYRKYETGRLRDDGKPGFNTDTGRIELSSTKMEQFGLDPLPYFEEPTEGPVSTPELMKEYPLILTTGARNRGFFHSEHRQIASLRATHPQPEIQIHPETAAKYGIEDGDWVWIENRMGKCRQKACITYEVPKWLVNADHGWWFPEEDGAEPNLFGVWKSNINQLVPFACGRSGFGGNYKSLICKIYKVKEGEM